MSKHSKSERERRTQENEAVARIQAAWQASVPAARAKEFDKAVAEAMARGPAARPPDMVKGGHLSVDQHMSAVPSWS